jgi:asparagine synthase (glutamine-hydrolysing)
MSAVLAVFSPDRDLPDDGVIRRVLARMGSRGGDTAAVFRSPQAVLATSRFGRESEEAFSGRSDIVADDACVVVADASLYYRHELRDRLVRAGTEPAGGTSGQLIHAAYRAWGERLLDHLEGDYAFVVWDRRTNQVFAARDFQGMRPLHFAQVGRTLVIASTIGAIREFPGCPTELNLVAVAETMSMSLAPLHDTCFSAIRTVPAGYALSCDFGRAEPRVTRRWHGPRFASEENPAVPFEDAAGELRQLLEAAVAERMPEGRISAITLSGGWDSPAVYAAAHSVRSRRGDPVDTIRPISVSYPPGDLGREDELIDLITERHDQTTHWLNSRDIPIFSSDFVAAVSAADDPFVHIYRCWNQQMGRAAAKLGARVSLNGVGGDHLFACDPTYLADLLRGGHLIQLAREGRAEGIRGIRDFRDWVIRPILSENSRRWIGRLRGGAPIQGHPGYSHARWLNTEFALRHGLEDRGRSYSPVRSASDSAEGYERRWMLEHPFFARTAAELFRLALADGVELRAPLMDRRIVAFAATRPRRERRSDRETKRLLRASVSDALPREVLAPRKAKTGTTSSYFAGAMLTDFVELGNTFFRRSVLEEMGILDRRALRSAMDHLHNGRVRSRDAGALFMTLSTEIWLRAQVGLKMPTELEARHAAKPIDRGVALV